MFQFWGKIVFFWAGSLKLVSLAYITLIYSKRKKIWKNPMFFSFYGQKTSKLGLKILAWFSKRANARKILKSLAPTQGIYCHKVYQLIPKLSEGYINPKRQKIISKSTAKKPKFSIFLLFLIYGKIKCLISKLNFGSDMPLIYWDLHAKF